MRASAKSSESESDSDSEDFASAPRLTPRLPRFALSNALCAFCAILVLAFLSAALNTSTASASASSSEPARCRARRRWPGATRHPPRRAAWRARFCPGASPARGAAAPPRRRSPRWGTQAVGRRAQRAQQRAVARALAGCHQHHGRALVSRAAGSAAPMHVRVCRRRHLVVHDQVDALDVYAARGDVRGHEHGRALLLAAGGGSGTDARRAAFVGALGERGGAEAVEVLQPRALLHVPVQALHRELQDLQQAQQAPERGDGVHEHDHQAGLLRQDVVQKRVALVLCGGRRVSEARRMRRSAASHEKTSSRRVARAGEEAVKTAKRKGRDAHGSYEARSV